MTQLNIDNLVYSCFGSFHKNNRSTYILERPEGGSWHCLQEFYYFKTEDERMRLIENMDYWFNY